YQDLDDLKVSVSSISPALQFFETSCFDGCYITGDITAKYLSEVESQGNGEDFGTATDFGGGGQLDLNLLDQEER
ncbi:MAG: amidophosphoribosyltransferase, partial [Betaproteobacteria bacterium]|nr:amidophosphoribosyltransferase [Betaproteobacteria bacterium]